MSGHAPHFYLSTACLHEDEDPAFHYSCRRSCKFCGAPCSCPGHPGAAPGVPFSWVDQARGMARRLLEMAFNAGAADVLGVLREADADPALFWLRNDEGQPPAPRRPPD